MKVGILSKMDERSVQTAKSIMELAKEHEMEVEVENDIASRLGLKGKALAEIEADIMICTGGDGTVLKCLRYNPAPVLGINTSIVGFLCEADPDDVRSAIKKLADGRYAIEERIKISTVMNSEKFPDAVNDVVIRSDAKSNVIWLRLSVNGEPVEDVRGDGIIISTPSGSTAYVTSAGGPIVDPNTDTFIIVPIAPFGHVLPPLVVPDSSKIGIEVLGRSGHLVIDGQPEIDISEGARILCRKSCVTGKLVRLNENFYRKIREKLL